MNRPVRLKKLSPSTVQTSSNPQASKGAVAQVKPASPTPSVSSMLPEQRGGGFKRGVMIGTNFVIAVESLWANRLRSLLTALGIFIGVAAVIAALLLTQGVGASINSRISSLGTNVLTIIPGAANSRGGILGGSGGATPSLTPGDAEALKRIPGVTGISPVISVNAQAVYGNQNWNTSIQGVVPAYQNIQSWDMAEGTWFSSMDEIAGRPVALLGQTVAHSLFDTSGVDPLGQTIRIRDQLYRVIGVLASKGGGPNQDDVVFVPFTTALNRLKNSTYVDQIQVQVDSAGKVDQVQRDATTILERRHHIPSGGTDDFRSISSAQLLQTAQQFTTVLTVLLVGIAAISLTVGGIGIMNIMIVSVTERTREIGIRMSLGARRSDIRNQFLIEALVLSLIGGIIGMAIGFLAGFAITRAAQLPFVVSATAILLPFIVSSAIGVIFGLYPAIRASRLDPIVALRTE